jgi:hypothetical protein
MDQNNYSIDYLNQIAPPEKKPMFDRKIAVIALIFILLGGSSNTQKIQTLAARLQTLQTIVDESQRTIKSSSLRTTSSNLSIYLTSANRDIVGPLQTYSLSKEKLDKNIIAAEDGAELKKALEDARLNAVFDRTYAREMSYQLATVTSLMQEIYNSTNSTSLKSYLETTEANLTPIKKQLADFNAANG